MADQERPAKRARTENSDAVAGAGAPPSTQASVVIQLKALSGDVTGPPLDVPLETTPEQLEHLVNELLENKEATPYGFYVEKEQLATRLSELLEEKEISREGVISIEYQPLSVYRVMPVTRCSSTVTAHAGAVLHTTFAPDGTLLASGGGDCLVRFWDTQTVTPRCECKGHRSHVLCTAFSPDGLLFASGDRAGDVRVWDPWSGKAMCKTLAGHKAFVTSLAWEPMHRNSACSRLASASKDKTVRIWNAKAGKFLFSLTGHTDSVECVKWGGSGHLYSASRDRTIKVWACDGTERGRLIQTLEGHGHRVNSLALSSDIVCRTGPFSLGSKLTSRKLRPPTRTSGEDASAGAGGGSVAATRERAVEAARQRWEELREQGPERLVSGSDDFTLFLWIPEVRVVDRNETKKRTGHQQPVNHISFSPDGRFIASASFDKKVRLWDGYTGKFLVTLHGHVGPVYQVCWSPDSRFLASASRDSTVKVWAARTPHDKSLNRGRSGGKALYSLPGHADEVFALDWSPQGEKVASGSKDRTIKMCVENLPLNGLRNTRAYHLAYVERVFVGRWELSSQLATLNVG